MDYVFVAEAGVEPALPQWEQDFLTFYDFHRQFYLFGVWTLPSPCLLI
jgi:hypothetical protein